MGDRFMNGFGCPVDRAYLPAFASRSFDVGDMLYGDKESVASGAPKLGSWAIQINRAGPSGWGQPLDISVYFGSWTKAEKRATTFGSLYMVLWRGDIALLDKEDPEPLMPPGSLAGMLRAHASKFRESLGPSTFVALLDFASAAHRKKLVWLKSRFKKHHEVPRERFTDFGLVEPTPPTVSLWVFRRPDGSEITPDQLREALGLPPPKKPGSFSPSRHGLLL